MTIGSAVAGGGPSLDDGSWKQATPPADSPNSDGYYLVDADRLRRAYRKRAIRRLQRLRSAGQLKLCGKFAYLQSDETWEAFVRQLESAEWVARAIAFLCGPGGVEFAGGDFSLKTVEGRERVGLPPSD